MRILQINSVYDYGSTGRIVKNLHHAIIESGNESYVIYGRGKKSHDSNVFKMGNKLEQMLDLVGTRMLNKHGQSNYINTKKIIEKIEEIQPDIVHLHNLHGYYINFERLVNYLKKNRIKVVWLLHDTWLLSGSSALQKGLEYKWESSPNLTKLKELSKEYPKHFSFSSKQSVNNYKIKKNLLSHSNFYFVTPSKWLEKIVRSSYLKNRNIRTIHNGIDVAQFFTTDFKKNKKIKIILGVASVWEESKGLAYFEKLANELDNTHLITLIGVSKKQRKVLTPKIRIIERTNSIQELVKFYNEADIFVNPTLYDNFPTVNIEAQACGTPVITFDTGGSGESIIDGVTGVIVEKGNYEELLNSIQNFPNKTEKQINLIRTNAMNFSVDIMTNNYLALYKELVNK